jgi:hypothetical protein
MTMMLSLSAATGIELLPDPPASTFGAAKQFRIMRPLALFLPARCLIEIPKLKRPPVLVRSTLVLGRRYDAHEFTGDFKLDFVSWLYPETIH